MIQEKYAIFETAMKYKNVMQLLTLGYYTWATNRYYNCFQEVIELNDEDIIYPSYMLINEWLRLQYNIYVWVKPFVEGNLIYKAVVSYVDDRKVMDLCSYYSSNPMNVLKRGIISTLDFLEQKEIKQEFMPCFQSLSHPTNQDITSI